MRIHNFVALLSTIFSLSSLLRYCGILGLLMNNNDFFKKDDGKNIMIKFITPRGCLICYNPFQKCHENVLII